MFELPEVVTLARQMNATLVGKTMQQVSLGPTHHKFLFLKPSFEEISSSLIGKQICSASSYGRSLYLHFDSGQLLWFGEFGGRLLYHPDTQTAPQKHHLLFIFADNTTLTLTIQMWGFVRILEAKALRATPTHPIPQEEVGISALDETLTADKLFQLMESYPEKTKKGVKGFLTTSVHINGIGNSYLQDILFRANIHPARKIPEITLAERKHLQQAIQETLQEAIALGGRQEEYNLYNQPGGYQRLMSSQTAGKPCPTCATPIEKTSYLGGAIYYCPNCQHK